MAAIVGGVGLLAVLATAALAALAIAGVVAFAVVCVRSYRDVHLEATAAHRAHLSATPRRSITR